MFVGWSGGACAGTGTCVIDFNEDTQVSANFVSIVFADGFE
jgi:hypothetical protein